MSVTGVIDPREPGREYVKVSPQDGARRIWVMDWTISEDEQSPIGHAGLHHHGGDEIFHVVSGTVRFHLAGRNFDVGAGRYVVVPPDTVHGYRVLSTDSRVQVVGEVGMGEWVVNLHPDGSTEQVEIRSNVVPWHRPPHGDEPFDLDGMMAIMDTTQHVLDEPGEDHTTSS